MLIQNNFNVVEKIAMFCTCTFFIIIYSSSYVALSLISSDRTSSIMMYDQISKKEKNYHCCVCTKSRIFCFVDSSVLSCKISLHSTCTASTGKLWYLGLICNSPVSFITKGDMQLPGVAPEVSFPMFENRQNYTSEQSVGFVDPD